MRRTSSFMKQSLFCTFAGVVFDWRVLLMALTVVAWLDCRGCHSPFPLRSSHHRLPQIWWCICLNVVSSSSRRLQFSSFWLLVNPFVHQFVIPCFGYCNRHQHVPILITWIVNTRVLEFFGEEKWQTQILSNLDIESFGFRFRFILLLIALFYWI